MFDANPSNEHEHEAGSANQHGSGKVCWCDQQTDDRHRHDDR